MLIGLDLLGKTCKEMIDTILLILPHATKGTIYAIGSLPDLRAVRVSSGARTQESKAIQWGFPTVSDYAYPGKTWAEYRDEPGRPLEAMGWCVEKQKSWTVDDPQEDSRSVRKQLMGDLEDFHHMEPVLLPKRDLHGNNTHSLEYALDGRGNPIWQDSGHVVVAVVKIHFTPYTIKRGDRSTRIIKKLSRTLGTEWLSLHLREASTRARKRLDQERIASCTLLIHELRNTLFRLGSIMSAIDAEIGFLREQWEVRLEHACPELQTRRSLILKLDELLAEGLPKLNGAAQLVELGEKLLAQQKEIADLSRAPQWRRTCLDERVRPKWDRLLSQSQVWDAHREEIERVLDHLRALIRMAMNENLAGRVRDLPEDLKRKWQKVTRTHFSMENRFELKEVLQFLDHPALEIPHKHQSRKVLSSFQVLLEVIPEIEDKSTRILHSLRSAISECSPSTGSI